MYGSPDNFYGGRDWWRGRSIDVVLAQLDYMPG
jgi:hypothetical protein